MAWDVSQALYQSNNKDVSAQVSTTQGLAFKTDGTKVYVLDDNTNTIYQYSLSTAWDITTASYDSKSFALADVAGSGVATGLAFKTDGTKVFTSAYSAGQSTLTERTLGTAWDISTAGSGTILDIYATITGERAIGDVQFKSDGTRVYIAGLTSGKVYHFNLSTAWDVSSTVSGVTSSNTDTEDNTPEGCYVNDDGTKLFMLGGVNKTVYQYTMSTPYDVSTATYDSKSFSVNSQDTAPKGMAFNDVGNKMYIAGQTNNTLFEYLIQAFVPQIIII